MCCPEQIRPIHTRLRTTLASESSPGWRGAGRALRATPRRLCVSVAVADAAGEDAAAEQQCELQQRQMCGKGARGMRMFAAAWWGCWSKRSGAALLAMCLVQSESPAAPVTAAAAAWLHQQQQQQPEQKVSPNRFKPTTLTTSPVPTKSPEALTSINYLTGEVTRQPATPQSAARPAFGGSPFVSSPFGGSRDSPAAAANNNTSVAAAGSVPASERASRPLLLTLAPSPAAAGPVTRLSTTAAASPARYTSPISVAASAASPSPAKPTARPSSSNRRAAAAAAAAASISCWCWRWAKGMAGCWRKRGGWCG
eukprot:m.151099 g.151099  ORF g.151099 m.151099 type:complete len:311 (+) comp16894_c4_seq18:1312-2244(+)